MESAEGEHGVTASTERDKVIQDLLNHLETLKPQGKGRIRMSTKSEINRTPTFLPGGMLLEDDKGRTRAIWDPEPKKPYRIRYRIGIMWLTAALGFILAATDVTVPAIWPIGMTALCTWMGCKYLSSAARRQAQHRPNKPVRVPERRPRVNPYYARFEPARDRMTRIGDAERDQVISELGAHFAAGRLDMDEYDERSTAAITAKTHGELSRTLAHLPVITRDGKTT